MSLVTIPTVEATRPEGLAGLFPRRVRTIVGIYGTGSDAQVTLRNPGEPSDGNGQLTIRLGDLMGSGLSGARGNGPVQNFNIGSLS